MEDHHVDRPGVEAQQCVQLTGTNYSIDLIDLISPCAGFIVGFNIAPTLSAFSSQISINSISYCADLVTMAKRLNPIPSRTRKLNALAPMVLHLKVWESRSLPGLRNMKSSVSFFTSHLPITPLHRPFLPFIRQARPYCAANAQWRRSNNEYGDVGACA